MPVLATPAGHDWPTARDPKTRAFGTVLELQGRSPWRPAGPTWSRFEIAAPIRCPLLERTLIDLHMITGLKDRVRRLLPHYGFHPNAGSIFSPNKEHVWVTLKAARPEDRFQ